MMAASVLKTSDISSPVLQKTTISSPVLQKTTISSPVLQKTTISSPVLQKTTISSPVLQKTTSSRVNQQLLYSSDDDLPAPPPELLQDNYQPQQDNYQPQQDNYQPQQDNYQPQQDNYQPQQDNHTHYQTNEQYQPKYQQQLDEDAAQRLQLKYAAPDNILPQTTTNDEPNDVSNITHDVNAHLTIVDNKDSIDSVAHVKKSKGTGSVSAFSDTSSDVSDATTSAPSATSSNSAPVAVPSAEGATENDIQQVDMFYRSQKTDVRVCQSLVNMYLSAAKTLDRMPAGQGSVGNGESPIKSPDPKEMSMEDWDFIKTGIPVLVLNTGEHLRSRKLSIILAEKGTGFSLWEDELNHVTKYETPHSNFHTLTLSTDHSRLVGFSFDEANAATEFADALRSLLPNPTDIVTNDKKKKKKKEKKPKQKYKPPRKIDISQPCCFVHVTQLERPGVLGLASSLFPPPPSGEELSQAMLRSRSQSSELSEYSTSPSEN